MVSYVQALRSIRLRMGPRSVMEDNAATSRRTPNYFAIQAGAIIWSAATCRRFSPIVGYRYWDAGVTATRP
jgi:hypothetical protein